MQLMISLSAYSAMNGLYKCAEVIPEDMGIFHKLCNELDVPEREEYHCTLMYSKVSVPHNPEMDRIDKYIAFCDRVDYLDGHDGKYIVAYIGASRLKLRNQEFRSYGCKPTFDEYLPHVTLASEVTQTPELDETIAELNRVLAQRPVTFTMVEKPAEDLKQ